jgi:hypothetical protein
MLPNQKLYLQSFIHSHNSLVVPLDTTELDDETEPQLSFFLDIFTQFTGSLGLKKSRIETIFCRGCSKLFSVETHSLSLATIVDALVTEEEQSVSINFIVPTSPIEHEPVTVTVAGAQSTSIFTSSVSEQSFVISSSPLYLSFFMFLKMLSRKVYDFGLKILAKISDALHNLVIC